jgi:protein SCO1
MQTSPEAGGTRGPPAASRSRRAWMALGLATGAAGAVAPWGHLGGPAVGSRLMPAPEHRIPDLPVLTHDGRAVHFYSDLVKDRIVFINMMYAQCTDRCPPTTQNLKRVQALLGDRAGKDVFMYSLSLRPEFDRPEDLRAYMRINEVRGAGWTFLTGDRAHVERLRRSLGFFTRETAVDEDVTQHTGMVCIGNDALDRWCMTPALLQPGKIVDALMAVDPVARANGRHAH